MTGHRWSTGSVGVRWPILEYSWPTAPAIGRSGSQQNSSTIDADTAAIRVFELDVGGSQRLHLGAGPRALLAFAEDELLPALLKSELSAPTPASIADPDALRADLAQTRQRGYSISRGDVTPDVAALGAPVFDATGRAVGAISIGGLLHQFQPPREQQLAEHLLAAYSQISRRLGYTPPHPSTEDP